MNHLAGEQSPYLLQHVENPVDWYPWGDEAFGKAKREDKPIFLSIGYATCHWCHVMERESFIDPRIAEFLNEHFVAIKVDREERPDIDTIYMQFVTATTGHGGWPMTVFLTPELQPFSGGTYFPPEDRGGMPGLMTVLRRIDELWVKKREKITDYARQVKDTLWEKAPPNQKENHELPAELLDTAYEQFQAGFDRTYGGFGTEPKFPSPTTLDFLLHYYHRKHHHDALEMVLGTLRAMANGGMYDQLGGGFHRYSTDRKWFVPHFEKMLYDQAQLVNIYLDAWQISHDLFFFDVARDVLEYVLREMTAPEGRFYCAQDADSARAQNASGEKYEGAFFIWSFDELASALTPGELKVLAYHYGVKETGNVDRDTFGEFTDKNVLFIAHTGEQTAKELSQSPWEVAVLIKSARQKLLHIRNQRPHPSLDDKTLVSWNSLMIRALARAGRVLSEPRYLASAIKAAEFIQTNLYNPQSATLLRRWRDGNAAISGFLDDYAFLIQALLDLYENTLDIQWLAWADKLQDTQDKLFWDSEDGGYFFTAVDAENTLPRTKDRGDNAEPAGNSVAVLNLLRLEQMFDQRDRARRAEKILTMFSDQLHHSPTAWTTMLTAVDWRLSKPRQIVLAGDPGTKQTSDMLHEIFSRYLPIKVILCADGGAGQAFLGQHMEFAKGMKTSEGKTTAYVCENYTCHAPTADRSELAKLLE
ncbi:MAG TPA: thioredoxin domain-containing protein [Phycisphaerae bacterium]|nr:thioredoxin domain-containing protein [Phycisphaerae bacterium]